MSYNVGRRRLDERLDDASLHDAVRFFQTMSQGRYDLIPLDLLHEKIHDYSQVAQAKLEDFSQALKTHDLHASAEHLKARKVSALAIAIGWCLSFLLFIPAIWAWRSQRKNARIDEDIRQMMELASTLEKIDFPEASSSKVPGPLFEDPLAPSRTTSGARAPQAQPSSREGGFQDRSSLPQSRPLLLRQGDAAAKEPRSLGVTQAARAPFRLLPPPSARAAQLHPHQQGLAEATSAALAPRLDAAVLEESGALGIAQGSPARAHGDDVAATSHAAVPGQRPAPTPAFGASEELSRRPTQPAPRAAEKPTTSTRALPVGIANEGRWQCYAIAVIELFRFNEPLRQLARRQLPRSHPESEASYQARLKLQQTLLGILQALDGKKLVNAQHIRALFTDFRACLSPSVTTRGDWAYGQTQDGCEFFTHLLDFLGASQPSQGQPSIALTVADYHLLHTSTDEDQPLADPTLSQTCLFGLDLLEKGGKLLPSHQNALRALLRKQLNPQPAAGPYFMRMNSPKASELVLEPASELQAREESSPTVQIEREAGRWQQAGEHYSSCRWMNAPPLISFQLKRFKFDGERTQRLGGAVGLARYLDISSFVDEQVGDRGSLSQYEISSIIVHQEGKEGAHYVFLQHLGENRWLCFDDDKVYPMEKGFDPSALEGAYLVSYRQRTQVAVRSL